MTYNVFGGTLNLAPSITSRHRETYHGDWLQFNMFLQIMERVVLQHLIKTSSLTLRNKTLTCDASHANSFHHHTSMYSTHQNSIENFCD